MCPLRFILVFFSAVLAGYFAWRTVRSSQETGLSLEDSNLENVPSKDKQELNFKRVCKTYIVYLISWGLCGSLFEFLWFDFQMIRDGFWGFVDVASGRYLWRNLREMKNNENMKSC